MIAKNVFTRVPLCLAIVALFCLPSQAGAQDRWLQVTTWSDHVTYLDTTTINRSGADMVRGWFRDDYFAPIVMGISRFRGLQEFRCKAREWRFVAVTAYNKQNDVLESIDGGDWQAIAPETGAETNLTLICALAYPPGPKAF